MVEVRRTALTFNDQPVEYRVSVVDTQRHDYVNMLSRPASLGAVAVLELASAQHSAGDFGGRSGLSKATTERRRRRNAVSMFVREVVARMAGPVCDSSFRER